MCTAGNDWWNSGGKDRVREMIRDELRPSFFDVLLNEARFSSEINSAVSSKLPSILSNRGSELIQPYVNLQVNSTLPALLNNNNYIQTQLARQGQQFSEKLDIQNNEFKKIALNQLEQFEEKHHKHLIELEKKSDNLIQSNIDKVSSTNGIVKGIENSLGAILRKDIDQLERSYEQNINSLKRNYDKKLTEQIHTNKILEDKIDNLRPVLGASILLSAGCIAYNILSKL